MLPSLLLEILHYGRIEELGGPREAAQRIRLVLLQLRCGKAEGIAILLGFRIIAPRVWKGLKIAATVGLIS
jgi:hypothetical protein